MRPRMERLSLLTLVAATTLGFRASVQSPEGAMVREVSGVRVEPRLINDWDGDGELDYAVGAPLAYWDEEPPRGAVVIVSGKTFKPITSIKGAEQSDGIGWRVVPLADMDGDGGGEIGVEGNELFQVYGRDGKVLWSVEQYVTCLASSWDVNEDTLPDVLVRRGTSLAILSGKNGEWLGSFGAITGNGLTLGSMQDRVDVLGDLDEDGFDDFVVVSSKSDTLHVYSGRSGAKLASLKMFDGMSRGTLNAYSATCHDINGDGRRDVVLGMPNWKEHGGVLAFGMGEDRVLSIREFEDDQQNEDFDGGYGVSVVDVSGVGPTLIAGTECFPSGFLRAYAFDGAVLWTLTLAEALAGIGAEKGIPDFGVENEAVPDRDEDGCMDIVTGASPVLMPGGRHPGRLFLISSKTGKVLAGLKEEDCLR